LPASQSLHTSLLEAPTFSPYLPAPQLAQAVAPTAAANLLAGHDVQLAVAEEVEPLGPYLPASHGEPEHVVEASVAEYVPASQLVQTVEAVAAEYVPAAHNTHPRPQHTPTSSV
jgi:hypothetical protein